MIDVQMTFGWSHQPSGISWMVGGRGRKRIQIEWTIIDLIAEISCISGQAAREIERRHNSNTCFRIKLQSGTQWRFLSQFEFFSCKQLLMFKNSKHMLSNWKFLYRYVDPFGDANNCFLFFKFFFWGGGGEKSKDMKLR